MDNLILTDKLESVQAKLQALEDGVGEVTGDPELFEEEFLSINDDITNIIGDIDNLTFDYLDDEEY